MRLFATIIIALLLPTQAPAADIYIRAGWLVDVQHGVVLRNQMIRIDGNLIAGVGPWTGAPEGAGVLDWSNRTVLPGLMDMHTHLTDSEQAMLAPLDFSEADSALNGALHARQTLMAGFTTVRNVGSYWAFAGVALRDAIDSGKVPGPRMAVAGAYITVPGGAGDITGYSADVEIPANMRFGVVNNAAEVRQRVRTLIRRGATLIKTLATGAVLTPGTRPGAQELSEAELRAAVEEAALHGVYVTSHAHGAEGIKAAVRAGVRSIEHGSLIDDEGIRLMKKHGTWLVADIYDGDYISEVGRRDGWPEDMLRKNEETTEAQRDGFRRAVEAGVRIAYGTDAGVYPHGLNGRQMAYMVRYGLTPMQAIQSATISAAELLGWQDRLGSIAPGKLADIIAVDGDLMADISLVENVAAVMKDGVLYRDTIAGE